MVEKNLSYALARAEISFSYTGKDADILRKSD